MGTERERWMRAFMRQPEVEWFHNIIGILQYFANDPHFRHSAWAEKSDAGVLLAVNDGWRLSEDQGAIGNYQGIPAANPARMWERFFRAERGGGDISRLFMMWGTAEQRGVEYGIRVANPERFRAQGLHRTKIETFTEHGNTYRTLLQAGVGGRIEA
jgi:phospholipase C